MIIIVVKDNSPFNCTNMKEEILKNIMKQMVTNPPYSYKQIVALIPNSINLFINSSILHQPKTSDARKTSGSFISSSSTNLPRGIRRF